MADRFALLIANDKFDDKNLHKLTAPTADVLDLGKVLENPLIGGFKVEPMINAGLEEVRTGISNHFLMRKPDDFVLIYYTGHGLRDLFGDLYLALQGTKVSNPAPCSIDADFIKRAMRNSFAKRQILILDCCHSGAYMGLEAKQASDSVVFMPDDLDPGGYGQFVLAASGANQSAFEVEGRSIFTRCLVEGLQTGQAAPNKEAISIHDLHAYACSRVAEYEAPMQPRLSVKEETTPVIIARNPNAAAIREASEALKQDQQPGVPIAQPAPVLLQLDTNALVEIFLDTDPVEGDKVIEPLSERGADIIAKLLERGAGQFRVQQTLRMRKLCRKLGHDAVAPLIDAIRNGEWHQKTAAAPCFAAFRPPSGEIKDTLFGILQQSGNFDTTRLTIEATGYTGYSSDIRWELADLAKFDRLGGTDQNAEVYDYSFGKLFSYVCEALARGFAVTGDESELDFLTKFHELCDQQGKSWSAENAIDAGFRDLKPAAADALVKHWLARPEGPYARMALDALAHLRNQRSIGAVASRLFDARDDISWKAGICLGNISSEATAIFVAEKFTGRSYSIGGHWAASVLYGFGTEWPNEKELIQPKSDDTSEIGGQMLVSLALRNGADEAQRAASGLTDSNPYFRGISALALAWARPKNAVQQLRHADEEAADEIERIFIVAAQILAGSHERGGALHEALRSLPLWHQLRPFWRYQIIAALRISHDGKERAARWAEISEDDSPKVSAMIDAFEQRATSGGPLSSA